MNDMINLNLPQSDNFKFLAVAKDGIKKLIELTQKTNTKTKKTSALTTADLNLLFTILNRLTYSNTSTIPKQKDLTQQLNISQKQVSTSINKLIKNQIIIKLKKQPRTYFINPKYFYLGQERKNKIYQWNKLLKEANQND